MFGMSVNEVPGWLVAMAPSAIGVPVAAWPGLVPHCDVSAVPVPAVLVAVEVLAGALAGVLEVPVLAVLLLPLLLQPAPAAASARPAASTISPRSLRGARAAPL